MKKKIVCIANDCWKDSDEKWGLNLFKQNGYKVEIWRVGKITQNFDIFEEISFPLPNRIIKTWKEFYGSILRQNIKNTIFIYYGRDISMNYSMALVKILGGKYCTIDFTSANNTRSAIIIEKKVLQTKRHWMDYFMPTYSFLGSKHNLLTMNSKFQVENGNNIYLHTYDYDVYLKHKMEKKNLLLEENKQPYILFIDQNFFDHKDQKNANMKKWIPDEKQFIVEMQRFLDEIEKQLGLPIIVSAHPVTCKTIYEIYGDRQIVYGNTCGYAENAELVICSSSGAMGFAVMYKKPLLLYNNYQLKRSFFYLELQMPKARLLGAKIVNISKNVKNINLKEFVTEPVYEQYIEYVTSDENQTQLFMDVVLKYVNTL